MSTKSSTEAVLDEALGRALLAQPKVAAWFLARTEFASEVATCVFCRWDNPWSSVWLETQGAGTGGVERLAKQCETDVLAVFQTSDGRRLAMHIENKLVGGRFTPDQPELYQRRKSQWKGREKFGLYTAATTVLVAPNEFYKRLSDGAAKFDSFVSHEDMSSVVPAFAL